MAYCIYKHTLILDCPHKGYSYIGQTVQNPQRRWRPNGSAYKDQIFGKAIQKYGWENFEHSILCANIETVEEANKLEEYYIKYYHTCIYDPDCRGYNVSFGGYNRENYGKVVLQLDLNKNILNEFPSVSAAARSVNLNPDRISRCCNHKNTVKAAAGYFWCFKKDYAIFEPTKLQKIKIYQLDSNKNILNIFDSIADAGIYLNKPKNNNISTCIKNNTNYAYGYYWCKIDDYDSLIINSDQHIKEIYCVDLDKTFKSITDAAIFAEVSPSVISRCCNNLQQHAGGYKWMYKTDYNKLK